MSIYDTDTIMHYPVTHDITTGRRTVGTGVAYACQIEDTSELISISEGQEVQSSILIFIDAPVPISVDDEIQLLTIRGTLTGDSKHYKVIKSEDAAGFLNHHREVWL